jgi:hypothetical protein
MNHFLSKDLIIEFIPNQNLRRLYITSQIVRTVISKLVSFYALSYTSLYKSFKKPPNDIKIGIIGLGHVGTSILQELIRLKPVPLSNILVSTRCPERHSEYLESGVSVFWDNKRLATECDFIILAVLPHHVETVCAEIRGPITSKNEGIFSFTEEERTPKSVVFSILAGTPAAKIVQMLEGYEFVLRMALDIDLINITIDNTGEEEVPLQNCLELLHEIAVSSVNYGQTAGILNTAFTGQVEIHAEVKKHFFGDAENPADRIKEMISNLNIIE